MTGCRHFVPLLEPFADGELTPGEIVEVEQHLEECRLCAERVRLGEALRGSLKRGVRERALVTSDFEERIRQALSAERDRERVASLDAEREARSRMLSWRSALPIAAAAAAVMVWAASANNHAPQSAAGQYRASSQPASVEQLVEDLVSNHVRATAPEITEASLIPQLEPEIGVPVKLPNLNQYGARWEGGSVIPVNNQRAASLRYRLSGHRVTLYVYDPSRFPIETSLKPRVVRNAPVYVGSRRGVSLAATERRGVGYAVATDLNDEESAELVASIY